MKHTLLAAIASGVFLLLLGGTRYYFAMSASSRPTDHASPEVNWARHLPAYLSSTAWVLYVAWLIIRPFDVTYWDNWSLSQPASVLMSWIALPFFVAGLWLFWYSHRTIGGYWSIQVELKEEHQLVTHGPYAYVRHPLYTALFLGYCGTMLALQSWMLVLWFPVFAISYLLFAEEEECVMEQRFGETYQLYRHETGMLLPKVARIPDCITRLIAGRRLSSLDSPRVSSKE